MYFDELTTFEERGGRFSSDPITALVYAAGGKWAVVGFFVAFAVFLVAAGFRAISLKRSAGSE